MLGDVTMRYILVCIFTLMTTLSFSADNKSMADVLGIKVIDRILIERKDSGDKEYKYRTIHDAGTLKKVLNKMTTVNATGSIFKDWEINRRDVVIIFHDDVKCGYFYIDNRLQIASQVRDKGSYVSGGDVESLVSLLIHD